VPIKSVVVRFAIKKGVALRAQSLYLLDHLPPIISARHHFLDAEAASQDAESDAASTKAIRWRVKVISRSVKTTGSQND
jgi:hypothetical protein